MTRRRAYGSGTVYRDPTRGDWVGRAEAGWTPHGTRRRITVRAKTEAEAKRKLRDRQRVIAAGDAPTAGGHPTVRTWSQTWLADRVRRVRPSTYSTDAGEVAKWVIPTIGHRRLDQLGPQDVRALESAMRDAGLSTTTIRYTSGLLRRLLKAAQAEGHHVPAQIMLTKPPRPAVHDRADIPLSDALAILEAAMRVPERSRWVAALLQGMRQAECLGLTWEAVDLAGGTIDVSWQLQPLPYEDRAAGTFRVPDGYETRHLVGAYHLTRPKTRRGYRVIPLTPWMRAALHEWQDVAPSNPWGLVWPGVDDRPGRGSTVMPMPSKRDRAAWVALQDAAQVARVDGTQGRRYLLHEARHTTATLLMHGHVGEGVVTALLGHSSIVTSRGYQHASQDLARAALEKVAARLQLGG